jgi:hypothetical protein
MNVVICEILKSLPKIMEAGIYDIELESTGGGKSYASVSSYTTTYTDYPTIYLK